jgi:hypothetical protein
MSLNPNPTGPSQIELHKNPDPPSFQPLLPHSPPLTLPPPPTLTPPPTTDYSNYILPFKTISI